jgi:hypothetical protein
LIRGNKKDATGKTQAFYNNATQEGQKVIFKVTIDEDIAEEVRQ